MILVIKKKIPARFNLYIKKVLSEHIPVLNLSFMNFKVRIKVSQICLNEGGLEAAF